MRWWSLYTLLFVCVLAKPQYDNEYSGGYSQSMDDVVKSVDKMRKIFGDAHKSKAQESLEEGDISSKGSSQQVGADSAEYQLISDKEHQPVPYKEQRDKASNDAGEVMDGVNDIEHKLEAAPPAPPRKEDLLVVSTLPYSSESSSSESVEASTSQESAEVTTSGAETTLTAESSGEEAGSGNTDEPTNVVTEKADGKELEGSAATPSEVLTTEVGTLTDSTNLAEGSGETTATTSVVVESTESTGSGEIVLDSGHDAIIPNDLKDNATTLATVTDDGSGIETVTEANPTTTVEHIEGSGENNAERATTTKEKETVTIAEEAADADLAGSGAASGEVTDHQEDSHTTTPHYVTAPEDEGYLEYWKNKTNKSSDGAKPDGNRVDSENEAKEPATATMARQPSPAHTAEDGAAQEKEIITGSGEEPTEAAPTASEEKEMSAFTKSAHEELSEDHATVNNVTADAASPTTDHGLLVNETDSAEKLPGQVDAPTVVLDSVGREETTNVSLSVEPPTEETTATASTASEDSTSSTDAGKVSIDTSDVRTAPADLENATTPSHDQQPSPTTDVDTSPPLESNGLDGYGAAPALDKSSIVPSGYEVGKGPTGPLQPDLAPIDPRTAIGYAGIPNFSTNVQKDSQIADGLPDTSEIKTVVLNAKKTWKRYQFDCDTEVDDKGPLCKDWAEGGLCEIHRPTMFLFCRKTCLCTGPI